MSHKKYFRQMRHYLFTSIPGIIKKFRVSLANTEPNSIIL